MDRGLQDSSQAVYFNSLHTTRSSLSLSQVSDILLFNFKQAGSSRIACLQTAVLKTEPSHLPRFEKPDHFLP